MFRETFRVVWMVIIVSLLLLMADLLIQYMQLASSGLISLQNVFSLLALQIPMLSINMLPLAFFLALLFALSRMYLNSEMVVLRAGGYSALRSYSYVFVLAIGVAIVQLGLSWYVLPTVEATQLRQMHSFQDNLSFAKVIPQDFQSYDKGGVFYVEKVQHDSPSNIYFFSTKNNNSQNYSVLHANSAHMANVKGGRYLVFDDGVRHNGVVNTGKGSKIAFAHYGVLLDKDKPVEIPVKFQPSNNLLRLYKQSSIAQAQLQWRLSLPLSILVLTAFVCLLAPVKPRGSQYGVIIAGVLVYAIYMNLLLWAKSELQHHPATWINQWLVHGFMLLVLFLLWLYRRRQSLLQ